MKKKSQSFLPWLVESTRPQHWKNWRNYRRNMIFDCIGLHLLDNIAVGLYFLDILLGCCFTEEDLKGKYDTLYEKDRWIFSTLCSHWFIIFSFCAPSDSFCVTCFLWFIFLYLYFFHIFNPDRIKWKMLCGKRWMKRLLLWRSVVWNFKLCEWVGNSVANWNLAAQRSTGTAELHLPGKMHWEHCGGQSSCWEHILTVICCISFCSRKTTNIYWNIV